MGQFLLWFISFVVAFAGGLVCGGLLMQSRLTPKIDHAEADARAAEANARDARDYASAEEERAAQEREDDRRKLSAAEERHRAALNVCRIAETQFQLARVVGQLQQLICVLEKKHETLHEVIARLLDTFESASSHIDEHDPDFASKLAATPRELELVLYPQRGSSASAADDESMGTIAALERSARLTAARLDTWIGELSDQRTHRLSD
jgi:hypothetical protein